MMSFRYHRFLCYRLSLLQAFSGTCLVITCIIPIGMRRSLEKIIIILRRHHHCPLHHLLWLPLHLLYHLRFQLLHHSLLLIRCQVHQHFLLLHHHFLSSVHNQFLLLLVNLVVLVRIDRPMLIL
jgi:hypothetical protein